jgi:hypothetical protein
MRIATRDSTTKAVSSVGTANVLTLTHTPYFFVVEWQYRRTPAYTLTTGTVRITKLDGTTVDIIIPFSTSAGSADGRSVMIPLACRKVEITSDPTGS